MMETRRYELILEATTPIAHHSETLGNSAIAFTRKVRQRDGSWSNVPIVTADTMRHGLREASTYALLDAAGMLDAGSLTEGALRLLFAGGMVTGRGDASAVKLDAYREMVDLVPPLALLGGCAGNRVVPGRLYVDDALLVCDETAHLVPEWITTWAREHRGPLDTCRAHVEEHQRVRMDPTLDPGKRKLLSDAAAGVAEQRLLAGQKAHDEDDAIAREDAKSSMMPRRYETIAPGSLFAWSVTATLYSELDLDTFDTMVATFLASARVGGKKGTGHGAVRPLVGNQIAVLRPRDAGTSVDFAALGRAKGQVFRAHVAERATRLRSFLAEVDA